jgi:3'(2'), 5'-bisphosphate nucleotidase
MNLKSLLDKAIIAAQKAGEEILTVYNSNDMEVELKGDSSPLTLADRKAHLAIMAELEPLNIPILSEEGRNIPYEERKNWEYLWIVDPLDGTKEFIKRNGEFTVNIALIQNGTPILGVIYVPVTGVMYYGAQGIGSFKTEDNDTLHLPLEKENPNFVAIGSRSHNSPETEAFFDALRNEKGTIDIISMGSSLKICLVAEGAADVYPRFAPTMEWDTAAGHAIASFAGKKLIDYATKQEMLYNRENLLNNWFIVE